MKKILALGAFVALLAMLVTPLAVFAGSSDYGSTTVSGNVASPGITITAPGSFSFGTLLVGVNNANSAGNNGAVTVTDPSGFNPGWTVTAVGDENNMYQGGPGYVAPAAYLSTPLLISSDGSTWFFADNTAGLSGVAWPGSLTYTGTGSSALSGLYAQQTLTSSDTVAGSYSLTITFTAQLTGF